MPGIAYSGSTRSIYILLDKYLIIEKFLWPDTFWDPAIRRLLYNMLYCIMV